MKIIKKILLSLLILILTLLSIIILFGGGFGSKDERVNPNNNTPIIFAHRGIANK